MASANQVFSVLGDDVNEDICALTNPFIMQLTSLAVQEAKDLRSVGFSLRDLSGSRDMSKIMQLQQGSAIDITRLSPLTTDYPAVTLMDEVAQFRAGMLPFAKDDNFWNRHKDILFIDYLLASSLCFVEIFDEGERVEKFFATRNRNIASTLANVDDDKTAVWGTYLQAQESDYQTNQLKVLKMTANASGYKVVKPRTSINFNRTVKVSPVFLMYALLEGVWNALGSNILKFTYIKDNLTEREFISTLSVPHLSDLYDGEGVGKIFSNISSSLERGYIKIPEYGASKYDKSGVRALNLSRITKIEIIEAADVDTSFVNVDFESILPAFKSAIFELKSFEYAKLVYEELTGKVAPSDNPISEIKNDLIEFVELQKAIGTTTALRKIHKYMLSRPQVFIGYTGKRLDFGKMFSSSFNLGVVD